MARDKRVHWRPYRTALERDGEITIGARARRQRLQRLLLGLVGLLLVIAAVALYVVLSEDEDPPAGPALVLARCSECGHEIALEPDPRRAYPGDCPHCEKHSVWPLWECRVCGERFIAPGPHAGPLHCPNCDSTRVGAAHASESNGP